MNQQQTQKNNLENKEQTFQVQAGSIKKGGLCIIRGFPCRVTDTSVPKPQKQSAMKVSISGIDIFTGKKYEQIFPTSATVYVPNIFTLQYQVADIDQQGFVSLIQNDGSLKNDLKLPVDNQQLKNELKSLWDKADGNTVLFTIQRACKCQKIVAGRIKLQE